MTGLEPVTSSLPRTRSTTELHRLVPAPSGTGAPTDGRFAQPHRRPRPVCEYWSGRRGSNPRPTAWKAVTLPLSYSRFPSGAAAMLPQQALPSDPAGLARPRDRPAADIGVRPGRPSGPETPCRGTESSPDRAPSIASSSPARPRATGGGEGRIRTSEAARATDLQSVAFDRSATSPDVVRHVGRHRAGRLSTRTLPRILGSWEIAYPARIRSDAPLHVRRFGRPAP